MIELSNVTIKTRHTILKNTTYTFQDGCVYGIIAINGSGKTTLFRTMMDLIHPVEGTILFDGKPVEEQRACVFYYETIEWLDTNLTGFDYLNFVKAVWKSNIDVKEVITEWKMEDYIHLPIKKYSLGMKQRLLIGMYIVSDAHYMIMDEITSGLDEENRSLFYRYVEGMKQKKKTILMSSHHKEDILGVCDAVLKIEKEDLVEITL